MPSEFYAAMVDRNIGVLTVQEQNRVHDCCVAVAGCGGMGGLAAEQLVRLGVGHMKIADFDVFEIDNINRQAGATSLTVGAKKTEVLGRYFMQINPELRLDGFNDGVTAENVDAFLHGADVVIDGIDYTALHHSILLHRAARSAGICVISPQAIGFGVSILVFGPSTVGIEAYVGLPPCASEETLRHYLVPIEKFCPYLPSYVDPSVAAEAAAGKINIPNIVISQHLGAGIAVAEAMMILLGRVPPPTGPLPRTFILDLQDRRYETMG